MGENNLKKRIRNAQCREKIMSAEEAASFIRPGMTIGSSGFTPAGYPKMIPAALAKRAEAGEKLDLTDVDVTVEVGLGDIEISDNADEGGARGHIVSIIYKGDHYQLIVRTEENEEDYVFDTEDLWNENDYVSVKIRPEKIRLKLKEEAAVK